LEKDKVFGYNTYAGNVYAISCGEFGIGFVLHGACCFGVYLFAYDKLGKTGSFIQLVNGVCLLLSFFFFRIIFGIYMSYHALQSVLPVISKIPTSLCLIYGVSNIILNLLNIIWFKKMIDALLKRFGSNDKVEVKKHLKSKEISYHNTVTYSATKIETKSKSA
ncbi:18194_t:CDS:2, partial [Entrophospora sp. SA101]